MKQPDLPLNEKGRLEVINTLEFLNRTTDEEIEEIIKLTSDFCEVPIVLISIIKEDTQVFYANKGLAATSTPRDISFCAHAILQDDLFQVGDASRDERFFDNPLVTGDPDIAFYAGQPLKVHGHNIGTLCVIDRKPRELSDLQKRFIQIMGSQVENIMHQKELAQNYLAVINDYQRYISDLEGSLRNFQHVISAISHDAIAPVKSIKFLVNMGRTDSSLNPADFMEAMEQSLQSSEKVLNDLLNWGIHELKKETREKTAVDLLAVATDLKEQLETIFRLKGNELVIPEETLVIQSENNKLRFIIRNLLVNSNKFTQAGRVELSWWKNNRKVCIQISDTGVGMNEDQVERLNMMEHTGSSAGTSGEKGFGIGLQLVRKFCQELGGEIVFESETGSGVTCTLLFDAL